MDKLNERDAEYRGSGSGVKYLVRGPKLDLGLILLRPGESLGAHYHKETEETFFVLAGEPRFVAGGKNVPARAGDVLRFPATESHGIANDGPADARIVFIKCPYKPEDKVAL